MLQMVEGMKKACGHDVPYVIGPRRPGDLAIVYADPKKVRFAALPLVLYLVYV